MRNRHVNFHSCISFFHAHWAYEIERHIFIKNRMYILVSFATDIGVNSREWRSVLENQFQSGFTENIENTVMDHGFMTVYQKYVCSSNYR